MKNRIFFQKPWIGAAMILTCALLISGCSGNKPKNFPKVVPASITVKSGGEPAQYINVTICPKDTVQWTCGGRCGQTGEITLRTVQGQYAQEGIPVGEDLIVCISYNPPEITADSDQERMAKMQEMSEAFELPAFFRNPKLTPLRWTTVKTKDPTVNHLDLDILECREMEAVK